MSRFKDYFEARRKFSDLVHSPEYADSVREHIVDKNSSFCYKYAEAGPNEDMVTLHTHSDGWNYELEDIARVSARRGIKVNGITDHSDDRKFNGKRLLFWPYLGGVILLRGMEIRSGEVRGDFRDLIVVGYKGTLKPFKKLEDTLKDAKDKEAIIIGTSIGNRAAKGIESEKVLEFKDYFDAIEILDSSTGAKCFRYYDIKAAEFARKQGIPGVYSNDSHTLREIGLAGFGITKEKLKFPVMTEGEVQDWINSGGDDEFIKNLKRLIKTNQFTNYGNYMPAFSLAYPDKFRTLDHRFAILNPYDLEQFIASKKNGNGN
jgi:predicted metal-dependent phosphoesterase TrpH